MTRPLSAPQGFLQQACLWALPAILLGAIVRYWLLSYSPYAYWGSDSESYFYFGYRCIAEGKWEMPEKREYVYPIFSWLVTLLPGAPLKTIAWVQHVFGLITLIPLAYFIQFVTRHWKLWVCPLTILYACLPVILWYEHELLGETLFTAFLIWAMAGWAFWQREHEAGRGHASHWYYFLVPFALCVLTKPSGRFFWPGLIVVLVYLKVWKHFKVHHWIATVALAYATFTLGESSQGRRLFYSSFFPLTQLDTPKHAIYKNEIRDFVLASRANLDTYYMNDMPVKTWLRGRYKGDPQYAAWEALEKKSKKDLSRLMRDLGAEALMAHPILALKHVTSRVVGSLDLDQFKLRRFEQDYFYQRYEESYPKFREQSQNIRLLDMAMNRGLPETAPEPEEFRRLTAPAIESNAPQRVNSLVQTFVKHLNFTTHDIPIKTEVKLNDIRPTWLGWLGLAGIAIALIHPRYRSRMGLWTVIAISYLFGVHFVGSMNPRFSMQVLGLCYILAILPLDALLRAIFSKKRAS